MVAAFVTSPVLKESAHARVIAHILARIVSDEWLEGRRIPSEAALARLLATSTGTAKFAVDKLAASGVLRREPRVGTFVRSVAAARAHEASAMARGGYMPLAAPTGPVSADAQQPWRAYLVVPCLPDSYLTAIVQGAERAARSMGIDVVLRVTDHDDSIEQSTLSGIAGAPAGVGVLLFPVSGLWCCDALLQLKLARVPVVVIDKGFPGVRFPTVSPDHREGGRLAAEHLIGLGHTDMGFVSCDLGSCSASAQRYEGYVETVARHGASLRARSVLKGGELVLDTPIVTESLRRALRAYLAKPGRPTAVFAANDYLAVALVEAAITLGLAVPGDLSVVGFSSNEVGLRSVPAITTIDHMADTTGERAMELLADLIHDPGTELREVSLPATLVVRGSSGPPIASADSCPRAVTG